MRNLILLFPFAFLLGAYPAETPGKGENVNELSCYRIKNKVVSHNDFNIWVITNEATLNDLFTADDCAEKPNFDEKLVVAMKVETLNYAYRVEYKKIESRQNAINVYFHVVKEGERKEDGSPVAMTEIPRDKSVKRINFYHDNMLVKSVPIVTVY